MSNPPYNPYAPGAQRPTQGQYELTDYQAGIDPLGASSHPGSGSGLGSSRASSGPSTNPGGMISSMHSRTMSYGPGQSGSMHTADTGSTLDMQSRGAREDLKLLSQLVQQRRKQQQASDWDTRSSLGVGSTSYPSSSSTSLGRLDEHSGKQSGGRSSMDWSSSYRAPSSASTSNFSSSSFSAQNMDLSHSSQSSNVFKNMDLSHSPQSSKLFQTTSYTAGGGGAGGTRIAFNEQGDTMSSIPGLVDYSLSDQPSSSLTSNRPKYTLESAANILQIFGLENEDMQHLNDYNDNEFTPENLPLILRDIRRRKVQKAAAASRSDVDRQRRTGSDQHVGASGVCLRQQEEWTPVLHQPSKVIDYGHSSKYTEGFGDEISGGNENTLMMDSYSSSSPSREPPPKDFGMVKSSGAGSSQDQVSFSGSNSYGSMLSSVTSASLEPPKRPQTRQEAILSAFLKRIKEPISPPKLHEDNRILEPKPPKSILLKKPALSPLKLPEDNRNLEPKPPKSIVLKKPALVPPKQSQGLKQTSKSIIDAFEKLIKEPISPPKEEDNQINQKFKPPKSILRSKKLFPKTTSPQRLTVVCEVNPSHIPHILSPPPLAHMTVPPPPLKPPAAPTVAKTLPTPAMMSDYSAITPRTFPHTCSLCNIELDMKKWIVHQNSNVHIESCRFLRKKYPDWNGEINPAPRDVKHSSSQSSKHHRKATRGSRSPGPRRYTRSRSPSTRRYSRSRSPSTRRYSRSRSPRRYSRPRSPRRYSRSSSSSTGSYSRSRSPSCPRRYSRSRSSRSPRHKRRSFSRSPHYPHNVVVIPKYTPPIRFPQRFPQRSPQRFPQRSPQRSPQRFPQRFPQHSPYPSPSTWTPSSYKWRRPSPKPSSHQRKEGAEKLSRKLSANHPIPNCSSPDNLKQTLAPAPLTEFTTMKASSSSRSSSKGSKCSSSHPSKKLKGSSAPSSSTSKTTSALRSQDVSCKKPKKENPIRRIPITDHRRPMFPPLRPALLPTPDIKPKLPQLTGLHIRQAKAVEQTKTQQQGKKVVKVAAKTAVKGSSSKAKTTVKIVKKPKTKRSVETSATVAPHKDIPKDSTTPAKVDMETAFGHSTASSKAETMATSNGATMATASKARHPCLRHPATKRVKGLSYHQVMGLATDDFKDNCILPSDTCPLNEDENWEEFLTLDEVGDEGDEASSSSDRRRFAKTPSVPEQSSGREIKNESSFPSSVDKQSWKESSPISIGSSSTSSLLFDEPSWKQVSPIIIVSSSSSSSSASSSPSSKQMESSQDVSKERPSATLAEDGDGA